MPVKNVPARRPCHAGWEGADRLPGLGSGTELRRACTECADDALSGRSQRPPGVRLDIVGPEINQLRKKLDDIRADEPFLRRSAPVSLFEDNIAVEPRNVADVRRQCLDRKSTRLNSSH